MTKKVKIEKVTVDDFEPVYPLLLDFNNPGVSKTGWKNLFVDHWNSQEKYYGYKLVDGSHVVGYVGYIFSRKQINGKWEKFCNMSSWIVKKEYRYYSIELLYPLKELSDYTLISFTPNVASYKALIKLFKFKELDRYESIIPAMPSLPRLLKKRCEILTHTPGHPQKILQFLSDYEKKIFQDHVNFDSVHSVAVTDQGNLYLIFKKVYKRHLPFAKLYFVSDPDLFLKHLEELRFRVPLVLKTVGMVIDSRFLKERRFHFSKNKSFFMPMVYKSNHLLPHEIDYLYSEFFLLGF